VPPHDVRSRNSAPGDAAIEELERESAEPARPNLWTRGESSNDTALSVDSRRLIIAACAEGGVAEGERRRGRTG